MATTTDVGLTTSSGAYVVALPFTSGSGWGTKYSDPGTPPPTLGSDAKFNNGRNDLGISNFGLPSCNVYPWSPGSGWGTKYSNPSPSFQGGGYGVDWTKGDDYISFAGGLANYVYVWPWSDGFGTKVSDPGSYPAAQFYDVAWSPGNDYIAFACYTSTDQIYVYPWSNGSFGTKVTDPASQPDAGNANGIAWRGAGDYIGLAVQSDTPTIWVWPWSGGSFGTKCTDPGTAPDAKCQELTWDKDDDHLIIVGGGPTGIWAYEWSSGFSTKISNPSSTPTVSSGIAFSSDGKDVAFTSESVSPGLFGYPWSEGFGTKYSDPTSVGVAYGLSFLLNDKIELSIYDGVNVSEDVTVKSLRTQSLYDSVAVGPILANPIVFISDTTQYGHSSNFYYYIGNIVTPSANWEVGSVSVLTGTVTGNISTYECRAKIWSITGSPDNCALNQLLATSDIILGSQYSHGAELEFVFPTPYTLQSGVNYAVTIDMGCSDGINYPAYHQLKTSSGDSWSSTMRYLCYWQNTKDYASATDNFLFWMKVKGKETWVGPRASNSIFDNVGVSENVTTTSRGYVSLWDSTGISENVSRTLAMSKSVFDGVGAAETVTIRSTAYKSIFDSAGIQDWGGAGAHFWWDDVAVSDNVTPFLPLQRSLYDNAVAWADTSWPSTMVIGTDESGHTASSGAEYAVWQQHAATQSDVINSIRIYSNEAGNAKVAIYTDSSNQPGTLIAQSNAASCSVGWNTISLTSSAHIVNGTNYWLAVAYDNLGVVASSFPTNTHTRYYISITYSGYNFPSTWSSSGMSTDQYGIGISGMSSPSVILDWTQLNLIDVVAVSEFVDKAFITYDWDKSVGDDAGISDYTALRSTLYKSIFDTATAAEYTAFYSSSKITTLFDGVGASDNVTNRLPLTASLNDVVGVSDLGLDKNITTPAFYGLAKSWSWIKDAPSAQASWSKQLTDDVGAAEYTSFKSTAYLSVIDNAGISENVSREVELERTLFDQATAAETVTGALLLQITLFDQVGAAENTNYRSTMYSGVLYDGVGASENVSTYSLSKITLLFDQVTAAETVAETLLVKASLFDNATASDPDVDKSLRTIPFSGLARSWSNVKAAPPVEGGLSRDLWEDVQIFENVSLGSVANISIIDQVGVSEDVQKGIGLSITLFDLASAAETVSKALILKADLYDNASASENLTLGTVIYFSIYSNANAAEAAYYKSTSSLNLSDLVSAADWRDALSSLVIELNDIASVSDYKEHALLPFVGSVRSWSYEKPAPSGELGILLYDDAVASENIDFRSSSYLSVIDNAGISENVSLYSASKISVFDQAGVSEYTELRSTSYLSTFDSASAAEFTSFKSTAYVSVIDNVGVSENVTEASSSKLSIWDSTGTSDWVDAKLLIRQTVIDNVGVAEWTDSRSTIYLTVWDNVGAGDDVYKSTVLERPLTDDVSASTYEALSSQSYVSVWDNVGVSDQVTTPTTLERLLTDDVSASTYEEFYSKSYTVIWDNVGVSENVTTTSNSYLSVIDDARASDYAELKSTIYLTVWDNVGSSENVSLYSLSRHTVIDNVSASDFVDPYLAYHVALLFDDVAASDQIGTEGEINALLQDDVGVSEEVSTSSILYLSIDDSIAVSELDPAQTELRTAPFTGYARSWDWMQEAPVPEGADFTRLVVDDVQVSDYIETDALNLNLCDEVAITDDSTLKSTYYLTLYSNAAASESISTSSQSYKLLFDGVSASENVTLTSISTVFVYDNASSSENVSISSLSYLSVQDNASASDFVDKRVGLSVLVQDTVTGAEFASQYSVSTVSIIDNATANDDGLDKQLVSQETLERLLIDDIQASEYTEFKSTSYVSLWDNTTASDTGTTCQGGAWAKSVWDNVGASDWSDYKTLYRLLITDDVQASEYTDFRSKGYVSLSDIASIADYTELYAQFYKTLIDQAGVSEFTSLYSQSFKDLWDGVGVSDYVDARLRIGTEQFDVVITTDDVALTSIGYINVFDGAGISDDAASSILSITIVDSVNVSELVTPNLLLRTSLFDTVQVSDWRLMVPSSLGILLFDVVAGGVPSRKIIRLSEDLIYIDKVYVLVPGENDVIYLKPL